MNSKHYKVTSEIIIHLTTTVRASSEKDAIRIAESRPLQKLCHRCSDGDHMVEWSINNGLTSEPNKLKIKESF